jgi:hypothetical protein
LRRIIGPKRDDVTRKWGGLHNKEFYDLYSSPNIIPIIISRRIRWARHVARRDKRAKYMVLMGRPDGKKPLGRARRRWENNKMDLEDQLCEKWST